MSQITDAVNEIANEINNSVTHNFKRLGDLLQEELEKGGAQQATAFEVTVNGGTSQIFVSPDDSRLNVEVDPESVEIRKVNSATAGC